MSSNLRETMRERERLTYSVSKIHLKSVPCPEKMEKNKRKLNKKPQHSASWFQISFLFPELRQVLEMYETQMPLIAIDIIAFMEKKCVQITN